VYDVYDAVDLVLLCVDVGKSWCATKIAVMPVAIVFVLVALILIGFIVVAVLLAIKLGALTSVSIHNLIFSCLHCPSDVSRQVVLSSGGFKGMWAAVGAAAPSYWLRLFFTVPSLPV